MTSSEVGSTLPRRQLGRKLKELRESSALTIGQAIAALEWSKPRLWRYETGQVPIHPNDVEAMCRVYGADRELTDMLKELARLSKARGWWQDYAEIAKWFELFLGMEAAASRIRQFQAEIIPGLAQTHAYAREVINTMQLVGKPAPEVLEKRLQLRMERQKILTRRTPRALQLDIILSEAALVRGFGPHLMVDQLTKLSTLTELPNVTIRVIPFGAGMHKGFHGPFLLLDFPRETPARDPEPTTVYLDAPAGNLYLDTPTEVRTYESIWANLEEVAVDQAESLRLITKIKERWSRE